MITGGYIVNSLQESERFLWDFRRTIADLIAEHYYGRFRELCHEYDLKLHAQPSGAQQFMCDPILFHSQADISMGEFWCRAQAPRIDCKFASSVAHLYGKKIVGGEAFTCGRTQFAWQNDPYKLKQLGDMAFCAGINHFEFHRYTHQPWLDRQPGMTFSKWGIQFERTNTWWNQASPWLDYLARCQHMLQQGRFVADICCLSAEGAPTKIGYRHEYNPPIPPGYDYDACHAGIVIDQMQVNGGRIYVDSGMNYKLLLLPDRPDMTPELIAKLKTLIQNGAIVVGRKPTHAPGLSHYPACDDTVRKLADEVWGNCDGKTAKEHRFGQGKVIWGKEFTDIFAELNLSPDFEYISKSSGQLGYIHRTVQNKEIYFVANHSKDAVQAICTFRVKDKTPELWHPETGEMQRHPLYNVTRDGRTKLFIELSPLESVFVVFQEPILANRIVQVKKGDHVVKTASLQDFSVLPSFRTLPKSFEFTEPSDTEITAVIKENGQYTVQKGTGKSVSFNIEQIPDPLTIDGKWEVQFPAGWGAPGRIVLDELISWTDHPEPGVQHFSGTATYVKQFDVPDDFLIDDHEFFLNLGDLSVIAKVEINGRQICLLWKPPYEINISDVIKYGTNRLEIHITNLWPNRLSGDAKLDDDARFTFTTWTPYTADSDLIPSGLFGPVQIYAGIKKQISW